MKSAGQRADVSHRLQVFHVHVFLVAPLRAGHMAQPGADQHKRRVAIRESAHYTEPMPKLTAYLRDADFLLTQDTQAVKKLTAMTMRETISHMKQ